MYTDWLSGYHYQEVFGRYTYLGAGVRGFGTTTAGAPTDGYGRIVYIDTHNSVYGAGWRRSRRSCRTAQPVCSVTASCR